MLSQFRPNLNQSIVTPLIVLVCILAVGALQVPHLKYLRNHSKITTEQALEKEVDSEKLHLNLLQKLPAFGFDNFLADWVFLQFAQYFGDDEARKMTGYTLSPEYFEVILQRDPKFKDAYLFLSASTTLYAAMPERSVALIEKGLKSLTPQVPPKSYFVWRYKAMDELLFLERDKAARQSFAKAAEWAEVYSDPESKIVAAVSRQTAESLAHNPRSKFAQVNAWLLVLENPIIDARTRKNAISRIEALGGKVTITPGGQVKVQLPKKD